MQTNASNQGVAASLSSLLQETSGTLLALQVHKVGEEHGAAGMKKVYGDDKVHVLLWTGFEYRALIERSRNKLRSMLDQGGLITRLSQTAYLVNPETTVDDACEGLQEVQDWFRRILSGRMGVNSNEDSALPPPMPPVDSVWRPLRVADQPVRGARVYCGPDRPDDPRAPKQGTIYLQGVKLGEVVLEPAPNGEWMPDSKPKTIVKKLIKEQLPVRLFVQYKLDASRLLGEIKVAEAASISAKDAHIPIDPEALRSLFKIAP